jgi:hypothetical protein
MLDFKGKIMNVAVEISDRQIEGDKFKQQVLEAVHTRTMEYLQQYASGLITFTELAEGIVMLDEDVQQMVGSKDGLLCPNTGLRFHKDFR